MNINREVVLKAVLECGTADLEVLDGVKYDLDEIVEDLVLNGVKPTLNHIMQGVFHKAASEMDGYVEQEIGETMVQLRETDNAASEEAAALARKLDALRKLEPQKDIQWYCNCLDTSVWFAQNGDLYRTYLPDAVDTVEDGMGFSFG